MDLFKTITDLVPFLAPYPNWVKGLICFWVFVSAALLGAILLARPSNEPDVSPKRKRVYLVIEGVTDYSSRGEITTIRVTGYINGAEYVYPSVSDIKWLEVSPDMAPQKFLLPPAKEGYEVRFEAEGKVGNRPFQARSTDTVTINSDAFGKDQEYRLYPFDSERWSRAGTVSRLIRYAIRKE
jgi:hypothetical protein